MNQTVGIDLGDRRSHYVVIDEAAEVVDEGSLATSARGLARRVAAGESYTGRSSSSDISEALPPRPIPPYSRTVIVASWRWACARLSPS